MACWTRLVLVISGVLLSSLIQAAPSVVKWQEQGILLPGAHRLDRPDPSMLAASKGQWLALRIKGKNIELLPEKAKVQKGFDECAQEKTQNITAHKDTMAWVNLPNLTAIKKQGLTIPNIHLMPNKAFTLNAAGQSYVFSASGKLLDTESAPDYANIANYTWQLKVGDKAYRLLKIDELQGQLPKLLAAVDLDNDGKLDFVFSAAAWYEEEKVAVVLSSLGYEKVWFGARSFDC